MWSRCASGRGCGWRSKVDEECADCLVPPLVLQPLIENAVKHGIATMVEGGIIRVEGHVVDGLMEVSVENDFDPDSPSPRRTGWDCEMCAAVWRRGLEMRRG